MSLATLPMAGPSLDRIRRIRRELADGSYVTSEKLDITVERLMVDLGLTSPDAGVEPAPSPPKRSRPDQPLRRRRRRSSKKVRTTAIQKVGSAPLEAIAGNSR